jgi:hypothetical protein
VSHDLRQFVFRCLSPGFDEFDDESIYVHLVYYNIECGKGQNTMWKRSRLMICHCWRDKTRPDRFSKPVRSFVCRKSPTDNWVSVLQTERPFSAIMNLDHICSACVIARSVFATKQSPPCGLRIASLRSQ